MSENPLIPKDLADIIKKLLRKNPIHRPSINELLEFQSIKYKAKYFKIELPNNLLKTKIKRTITNTLSTKSNNYST